MLLHVTNGESAGNTLRQTGLGGDVLAWNDVLHEGPVPQGSRAQLLDARAAFLAECGWGSRSAILASLERRDRQLLDAEHVVLWFEHDLYDQLQLIDALALLDRAGATPELMVVDSFLGSLQADELEALWPARVSASPAVLAEGARAWDTFRAPDPSALAAWDGDQLQFLGAAFRRLLEELPSVADGLSGTERRALEAIAGGARTPAAAFVASQRAEEAAFLGDAWFYRTLSALGSGREPLVETVECELRLTANGERVLRGDADRVELLGLDRWLGGTHVTTENLWRWDDGRLVRA